MPKITFPTKELIRTYFDENTNWLNDFETDLNGKDMGFKDGSNGYYYAHHVDEKEFKDINRAYSIMDKYRSEYIGIDIPTLIEPDHPTKTIMIIGQDPLRSKKPVKAAPDPNTVFIGTPYAVEIDTVKTKNTGGTANLSMYRKIFSGLLNEGYRIYLTDALKFFTSVNTDSDAKGNDSTSIEKYTRLLQDPALIANKRPEKLLEDEYNAIKPDLVCCFGAKSFTIAENTFFKNELKQVYHPSYLARIFGNNSPKLTQYSLAEITGKLSAAEIQEFKKLQEEKKANKNKFNGLSK